jgi:hypothetical protein
VEAALVGCYPGEAGQIDGYREVYERLVSLGEAPSDFMLRIEHRKDADEEWIEVYGEDGTSRPDGDPERFALELMPWSEWLGAVVPQDLLQKYSPAEIAAHCLYEMTFVGFDEETIQAEREELSREARELEQMTPEEREKHLIPWETIEADLDRLTE